MEMTTMMVVAADANVRRKLAGVVDFMEGFQLVAEAITGAEALETARRVKPFVILLEVGNATLTGFEFVSQIRESVPGVVVVVTAASAGPEDFRLALKAGAKDFLVMPYKDEVLVEALQCAAIEAHRNARMYRPVTETHGAGALVDVGARRGKIYTICGLKGGVGKTSIAVNLAIAIFRNTAQKVALIDLDLQKGDCGIMLNLHAHRTVVDLVEMEPPWTVDDVAGHLTPHGPSGLEVLLAPSNPEQAEAVSPDLVAEFLPLLQEYYDHLIVDTSTAIRDMELTVFDLSYLIMPVVNLELPAIKNTKALLDLLKVLRYPPERIKLILNQGFPALAGIDVESVQNGLRREVFGLLPSAGSEVVRALSKGKPFMLQTEPTDLTKAYEKLAEKLLETVSSSPSR